MSRRLALLAVLALAAVLRFGGLDWGLRHPPHMDERVFVENVFAMMRAGDLDHRYYEYPGLVFYLLWPVLRVLSALGGGPGPMAYLLARGVVAAFGVLGCALLYPLGRRLHSPGAGLAAAALMAVSPVAVETAHMVRPDVILQALAAGALLALLRLDGRRRSEMVAGILVGLAMAAKFSGVFLLPAYLAARVLGPGRRGRLLAVGCASMAASFALASPYALLHAPEFVEGVEVQLRYHYEPVAHPVSYPGMLLTYGQVWVRALGAVAAVLSLLGLWWAWPAWRRWLPPLLLVVVSFAVLATSDIRHDRFLLPALSTGCVLAGAALVHLSQALAKGAASAGASRAAVAKAAGLVLALAAAAAPLAASVHYVEEMRGPLLRDQVLDWAAAHLPDGARVLSTVPLLGLDTQRLDVLVMARVDPASRPQVLEADYVLSVASDEASALAGLEPLVRLAPATKYEGRTTVTAWRRPPSLKPPYRPVELQPSWLASSDNADQLPALCDRRPQPFWTTAGPQQRGDWVQVALPRPMRVARIEMRLGQERRFAARQLRLEVSGDGQAWVVAPTLAGRPPVEAQSPRLEHTQLLLVSSPQPVRAVRLVQTGLGWRRRWGMAELRIWELP